MTIRKLVLYVGLACIAVCFPASGVAQKKSEVASAAAAPVSDPVLVGAGDIATCGQLDGAEATAKLIDHIPEQCLPWAIWRTRTAPTSSLPNATDRLGAASRIVPGLPLAITNTTATALRGMRAILARQRAIPSRGITATTSGRGTSSC